MSFFGPVDFCSSSEESSSAKSKSVAGSATRKAARKDAPPADVLSPLEEAEAKAATTPVKKPRGRKSKEERDVSFDESCAPQGADDASHASPLPTPASASLHSESQTGESMREVASSVSTESGLSSVLSSSASPNELMSDAQRLRPSAQQGNSGADANDTYGDTSDDDQRGNQHHQHTASPAMMNNHQGHGSGDDDQSGQDGDDYYDEEGSEEDTGGISLAHNQMILTLSYSLLSQVRQVARMEGVTPEDILLELIAEGVTKRAFQDAHRPVPSHLMTRTGYVPPEANGNVMQQPSLSHHTPMQSNGRSPQGGNGQNSNQRRFQQNANTGYKPYNNAGNGNGNANGNRYNNNRNANGGNGGGGGYGNGNGGGQPRGQGGNQNFRGNNQNNFPRSNNQGAAPRNNYSSQQAQQPQQANQAQPSHSEAHAPAPENSGGNGGGGADNRGFSRKNQRR